MKEDLNFQGNRYHLLATFFTCVDIWSGEFLRSFFLRDVSARPGFGSGKLVSDNFRPARASWYLPTAELCWSIIMFRCAGVQNVKTIFAPRLVVGMLESPYAVGVITVVGRYYTKRGRSYCNQQSVTGVTANDLELSELGKRIAIFCSASYAANIFNDYLQASIYRELTGRLGLAGQC